MPGSERQVVSRLITCSTPDLPCAYGPHWQTSCIRLDYTYNLSLVGLCVVLILNHLGVRSKHLVLRTPVVSSHCPVLLDV